MSNNPYLHVYKTQLIRCFTYKFEVYSNILIQSVIMLANGFFWRALFRNTDSIKGVTAETMLTYTVVASLISVMLTTNVERRIESSVQKGTVAIDLMRPVDVYKLYFAENLANVTGLFFLNALPILLIGGLLIQVPRPASGMHFLLFLASLVPAFLLNWMMALIFGMWAFWVIDISALLQVKKHLIRLLSGSLIPIWFFPGGLRTVLQCLPFVYLYQLPLDIYIGRAGKEEILRGFSVQIAWLAIMFILFVLLRRKVRKKLVVQGG